MKKKLLFGLAAVSMMAPSMAFGASKTVFNANNVILPSAQYTPEESWEADTYVINTGNRYEGPQGTDNPDYNHVWGVPNDDKNGNPWYAVNYELTDGESAWETNNAPFSSDETYNGNPSYQWVTGDIMGDIYFRRTFTLDAVPGASVYLACGHDDAPSEWYINGVLVHSVADGWKNDEYVLLTADQKALLKPGKNIIAVHVHQNWGGAFADCGLYEAEEQYDLLSTKGDGWWPSYYKTLSSNGDIETAVANGCFNNDPEDNSWQVGLGPFGNDDESTRNWGFRNTFWNSNNQALLVRRHFTLSDANATALKNNGTVTLTVSYDEWPVVYLNGHEIWSVQPEYNDNGDITNSGWNDANYANIVLSAEAKSYLKGGDNVIGISVRQGGGGGHIDLGLFTTLPVTGFTDADAPDVDFYKSLINMLITKVEALDYSSAALTASVENAKATLGSSDSEALRDAFHTLFVSFNGINEGLSDIKAFEETWKLYKDDEAKALFDAANTGADYAKALKALRLARRASVAETHPDVFKGNAPAEGEFYLYNVGRKQFLQGGSDWGAHASLGLPGRLLTLELKDRNDGNGNVSPVYAGVLGYTIKTGLSNGSREDQANEWGPEHGEAEYLSYGGYMDTPYSDGSGGWVFLPVDGMENTYYMAQSDYESTYVMWNPMAGINTSSNDETYVHTETRNAADGTNPAIGNPNAMWKLVTKDERDALLETASLDAPADASFYIECPNFSQRDMESVWSMTNFSIWGRNYNWPDFVAESYDGTADGFESGAQLEQVVDGLPAGVYVATIQGYYRNSTHAPADQVIRSEFEDEEDIVSLGVCYAPEAQNAFFYAGNNPDDDTALPYILSEANKCPGEGRTVTDANGKEYNIPGGVDQNACVQATAFFKMGLYKTNLVFELDDYATCPIGVYKGGEYGGNDWLETRDLGDWIVVDNVRLKYYGADTTKDAVKDKLAQDAEQDGVETIGVAPVYDGKIYNLQGIQVKEATAPGIYIQNGKKFVVTK